MNDNKFLGFFVLMSGILTFLIGILNTFQDEYIYLSKMLTGICLILISYKLKEDKL